jgi:tRNA/tmRNA/rRNA uracil-C5-methylase (TrmA/RlmC/RlmD family)
MLVFGVCTILRVCVFRPVEMTSYRSNSSKKDDKEGQTIAELIKMMESGKQSSEDDRQGPRIGYMIASAKDALYAGQALGADVLIVDPPRKGLEDEVLAELCKPFNPEQPYIEETTFLTMSDDQVNWTNDVQTIIYVSCGFDALARDADRLLSRGWMLEKATGYVLFPGSDHVETVCIFQRKNVY